MQVTINATKKKKKKTGSKTILISDNLSLYRPTDQVRKEHFFNNQQYLHLESWNHTATHTALVVINSR